MIYFTNLLYIFFNIIVVQLNNKKKEGGLMPQGGLLKQVANAITQLNLIHLQILILHSLKAARGKSVTILEFLN